MRVLCPPLSWNSTLACLALVCVPVRSFRLALPQGRTSRFRALTGLSMTTTGTEHVVGESTAQGWKDAVLPFLPPERCRTSSPAQALERGEWFKLICGASFEVGYTLHMITFLIVWQLPFGINQVEVMVRTCTIMKLVLKCRLI